MKQSAVDPSTGRVDINILAAGMSASSRKLVEQLAEAIRSELSLKKGVSIPIKKLIAQMRQSDFVSFLISSFNYRDFFASV